MTLYVSVGEIQHTEQAVQPQSTVPLNQQMMLQNYDYEDEDEEEDVTAKSKKEVSQGQGGIVIGQFGVR